MCLYPVRTCVWVCARLLLSSSVFVFVSKRKHCTVNTRTNNKYSNTYYWFYRKISVRQLREKSLKKEDKQNGRKKKKKWFIDMLACITLCIYVYSVVCIVVWRGMFGEKKKHAIIIIIIYSYIYIMYAGSQIFSCRSI